MHIVVPIKQTPDTTATLTVDASGRISWGDAPLIVNPWDEFAIEESLRLKEKFGGKVTVITMGAGIRQGGPQAGGGHGM